MLDSIFYVLRSGCRWRMLPRDLLPWDAAHRWFTKWRRDGSWDRIHDEPRRRLRIGAGGAGRSETVGRPATTNG